MGQFKEMDNVAARGRSPHEGEDVGEVRARGSGGPEAVDRRVDQERLACSAAPQLAAQAHPCTLNVFRHASALSCTVGRSFNNSVR